MARWDFPKTYIHTQRHKHRLYSRGHTLIEGVNVGQAVIWWVWGKGKNNATHTADDTKREGGKALHNRWLTAMQVRAAKVLMLDLDTVLSFIISVVPLVLPPTHHICFPRTLLWAATPEKKNVANRVVYAENTDKQNAKQILCLFSACDHLKGIFQRPRLILAPAKWSFHSTLVIFSPSEGTDWPMPQPCDQIFTKWVVYVQIHMGVNNGTPQYARLCVCLHTNTSTSPCQCPDAASAHVDFWCSLDRKHRGLIAKSVLLHCSSVVALQCAVHAARI